MRVVLDLAAGSWLGGRTYLRNLALALRSLPEDEQPEILGLDPDAAATDFDDVLERVRDLPAEADVVFPNWSLPARAGVAQMGWIPDLQHRSLPDNFSLAERLKRDVGYRRWIRRARIVVVSSQAVGADVARAFRRSRGKLRVVHFRTVLPREASARDPLETVRRLGLPPEFLLLPNQLWRHKNHRVAFEAAPRLPLPLVCTGATEDYRHPGHAEELRSILRRENVEDRVHLLGVVDRDDYLQLLRAARAIVQPSLFEGWSSIVEDARAVGRPIALSDIPVHREQAPPGGHYFPPHDADTLVAAVGAALAEPRVPDEEAVVRQERLVADYAREFLGTAEEAGRS